MGFCWNFANSVRWGSCFSAECAADFAFVEFWAFCLISCGDICLL